MVFFVFSNSFSNPALATGGMVFTPTQKTFSPAEKEHPEVETLGSKIYYVWQEYNGSFNQIWTAEMNTDGTGWTATKQTTTGYNKQYPHMSISGSKIYYVWQEYDGSFNQIWTAEMNSDGTSWLATKRTTSLFNKTNPKLYVLGSKIYYTWDEKDAGGLSQIWTAEMNTNGTGFTATPRTSTFFNSSPDFKIYNNQLFIVWSRYDSATPGWHKLMLSQMNTDGTGWMENELDSSNFCEFVDQMPKIEVDNGNVVVSYLKCEYYKPLSGYYLNQRLGVVNATSNGWKHERLIEPTFSTIADIQIYLSNVYVSWGSASDNQIWTGVLDLDDFEWRPTIRTNSGTIKTNPSIAINDPSVYYTWSQQDGVGDNQIWTAVETNQDSIASNTNVTATVPSYMVFTVYGINSGTVNGTPVNIVSAPTDVNFGIINGANNRVAAQELEVRTNASGGYTVTIQYTANLSSGIDTINNFTGTNTAPAPWNTPPGSGTEGYFGYTTEDFTLGTGIPDRFSTNLWSGFTSAPLEVMYHNTPVDGTIAGIGVTRIGYQLEITNFQPSGTYTSDVTYICTPVY